MAAVIGRGLNRVAEGAQRDHPKFYESAFISYYIVTFATNGVAIIGGALSQFDSHRGRNNWYGMDRCDGWLFTNGIFGVIHILAAMYIVRKIQEPEHGDDDDQAQAKANDYQIHRETPQFRQPVEWANDPYVIATPVYPNATTAAAPPPSAAQEPIPQWVLDDYNSMEAQQQRNQKSAPTKKSGGWGGLFSKTNEAKQTKAPPAPSFKTQRHSNHQQNSSNNRNNNRKSTSHELSRSSGGLAKKNAVRAIGPPDSWQRIKHVLCENYVVAIYILVFLVYLAWHFFSNVHACNAGMAFAMKCADIFIYAAPCALLFSLAQMQMNQRRL